MLDISDNIRGVIQCRKGSMSNPITVADTALFFLVAKLKKKKKNQTIGGT